MADVRVLQTKQQECDADIVAKLEHLLKEARSGEIVAVGFAVVYRDHSIGSVFGKNIDVGRLLGAVAYLSARIVYWLDAE